MCNFITLLSVCIFLFSVTCSSLHAEKMPTSDVSSKKSKGAYLSDSLINLTLSDAVFLGLRQNRDIRSEGIQRIAQKYDLKVANSLYSPKLMLTGQYTTARDQDGPSGQSYASPVLTQLTPLGTQISLSWVSQMDSFGRSGRFRDDGASLQIVQPLLKGFGTEVTEAPRTLARLAENQNQLSLQDTVSKTITSIILSYRSLVQAQDTLSINEDSLKRSRQLIEINKALIDSGRMAQAEIIQTEANATTQELSVEEAKNDLASRRRALLRLLALGNDEHIVATDPIKATEVSVNVMESQNIAFGHRPDYLRLVFAHEEAETNLVVAKNSRLWSVNLVGGVSQGRQRFNSDFDTFSERHWQSYVGVQVQIPIGDPSVGQAEAHAKSDLLSSEIKQEDMQQQVEQEVSDAVETLSTRWRQFKIATQAYELTAKKLDIEKDKLAAGRSSNFQVLSFEADLRNAENAKLNAVIGYLNAQTDLDEKLGMTLQSWGITLND